MCLMSLRKNPYRLILKITLISLADVLGDPQLQTLQELGGPSHISMVRQLMSLTSVLLWKLVNPVKRKRL